MYVSQFADGKTSGGKTLSTKVQLLRPARKKSLTTLKTGKKASSGLLKGKASKDEKHSSPDSAVLGSPSG